ncbi:hypothetical protein BLX06_28430 [Bacillus cereus]|uniref:Uncharacterized protein n=1 Tax=Bacillus cereus TaxID=1396 RepID=A0A9X6GCV3_BACCE|nr:hypothetical protein BLX06_28430 [Bacillus cereus]
MRVWCESVQRFPIGCTRKKKIQNGSHYQMLELYNRYRKLLCSLLTQRVIQRNAYLFPQKVKSSYLVVYCILYNTQALRASFFADFTKKMWQYPEKIRQTPKHLVKKINHSYAW